MTSSVAYLVDDQLYDVHLDPLKQLYTVVESGGVQSVCVAEVRLGGRRHGRLRLRQHLAQGVRGSQGAASDSGNVVGRDAVPSIRVL